MTESTQAVETNEPKVEEVQETTETPELGSDGKPFDPERAQALIEKLREESRLAKADKKKLEAYQEAEKQRKEAEMTELEKLQSQLKEKDELLKQKTYSEMQRTAADKFKLPPEFVDRLKGETLEELEADAKKLSDLIPKQQNISPTNVTNNNKPATNEQWHNYLYKGGPLPT